MSFSVYKYPIHLSLDNHVTMPFGARVLKVDDQHGTICIWALVDTGEETQQVRHFEVYGTGHPIMDMVGVTHVGTLQQGPFVWHVFERVL